MSKRYKRRFETDGGGTVVVPSALRVAAPKGECVKAVEACTGRGTRKKSPKTASQRRFVKEFEEKSNIPSPTEIVCERMREGWYLPYTLGATGGHE